MSFRVLLIIMSPGTLNSDSETGAVVLLSILVTSLPLPVL